MYIFLKVLTMWLPSVPDNKRWTHETWYVGWIAQARSWQAERQTEPKAMELSRFLREQADLLTQGTSVEVVVERVKDKVREVESQFTTIAWVNQWGITRTFNTIPPISDNLLALNCSDAYNKLMSLQGRFPYQKARWGAALPIFEWIRVNLIESGWMTVEELGSLPMLAFQKFDPRLAMALHNAKRRLPK